MHEDKEEFIRKRRTEFNKYENLLKAIVSLKKFLEENFQAKYYFGGKLKNNNMPDQTPDIIIKLNDSYGIIGEAKKGFAEMKPKDSKEEYIKRYIESDLFAQLKKYDRVFENLKVATHDLILLAPQVESETIGMIKFDFLDKRAQILERNFALITYSIELQANTKRILVKYDYGRLSNAEIFDKLRRGINYFEGELSKDLGKYKIYEENENSTPMEYIMVILWDSIFNEILNSSNKEEIVDRYRKRENKFEVKLSKLMEYLRKMYTIPAFTGNNVEDNNYRNQFKIKSIKDAMDIFCQIGLAKIISKEANDCTYEVTLKILPEKDELNYFLTKIHEAIKNQKFVPEVKGTEKLDRYFLNNN